MTKEKIIIDSVDVSTCKHYINSTHLDYNCNKTPASTYCKNNPDCYFKQLKRKEQECEELKKQNEKLKIQLMQKSEVDTFFNTPIEGWDNDPCKICEYKQNYQAKEQEYKNLEEELRGCRIGLKDISTENTKICKISEKYKRALDEIEEFCITYSDNHDAYETVYKFILAIINKAKAVSSAR